MEELNKTEAVVPGGGFSLANPKEKATGYKYIDEKRKHLHTLDGNPLIGTSSASDVLAKPLTWWASGLAVKVLGIPDSKVITKIKNRTATKEEIETCMDSCELALARIKKMNVEDYYKLLDEAYRAHATTLKEKADEGTDLHAELERFIKDEMGVENMPADRYEARILPYITWSRKTVKRYLWSEAHCFSRTMWTGGISDVGAELNDGKFVVIDFKSSKEAYKSQFWQCVGYAMQIEENGWLDREGNVLGRLDKPIDHVCVVAFGAEVVEPKFYFEMATGKEAFKAELFLYTQLNV